MSMPTDQSGWFPSTPREQYLTFGANPATQKGLEIGALHNPIVRRNNGHEIYFVDYATTETLKARHSSYPERISGMVDVDYVWQGSGSLSKVVGADRLFDYVIASHVIEHVPNMLGWFRGVSEVMKTGAYFNLACPDKRFTFDIRCPDSTVGQLMEADLAEYTKPSVRQMFDHCYYAKAISPGEIWTNKIDVDAVLPYSGVYAPELAMAQALEISNKGTYFDSHCWIFTPSSFLDLIEGAVRLTQFPLIVEKFTPTSFGGFEFYVSFKKTVGLWSDDLRLQQVAILEKIRHEYLGRARWCSLLAD